MKRRGPPAPKRRRLPLVLGLGTALGIAVLLGFALPGRPKPPPPPAPPPPAVAARPPAPPAPAPPAVRGPVDQLLDECAALVRAGKSKEAAEKIDWFAADGLTRADVERLARAREELRTKSGSLVEDRVKQAEQLARKGLLREATDLFQDLDEQAGAEALGPAYLKLRTAAETWLVQERARNHESVLKSLAELEAADAGKKVERLARAQARHEADQPLGVLHDALALLSAGQEPKAAVELLHRVLTRAPMDETVLRYCERELARNPQQPGLWELLSTIWTWRHDPEEASKVYFRAMKAQVKFEGQTSNNLVQFLALREKGFPAGKPVVVDYAGPYEILTDATPRRARELARQLDGLAREYGEGFKRSINPVLRFRVLFFSKERDYQLYHKGVFGMSARERGAVAYYSPGIKQLVVVDSSREFQEVVRHEAFHQFLDYFVHGAPRWFNEGSAAFFERSTFGRPRLDEKYHNGARHGLTTKALPPLAELLQMSASTWVGDPREFLFYCQAWSFIYWLHAQGRASLLEDYLNLLVSGATHAHAYEKVFAPKIPEFEPAWRRAVLESAYPAR